MRIIVIGAGIGGLAAALTLGRSSFEVQVFEQASELREVGAGVQINPNATRILHRLLLLEHRKANENLCTVMKTLASLNTLLRVADREVSVSKSPRIKQGKMGRRYDRRGHKEMPLVEAAPCGGDRIRMDTDGRLRHLKFVPLRDDRIAREVTRE
jgi:choline dehydrogenase-like flavoprotein